MDAIQGTIAAKDAMRIGVKTATVLASGYGTRSISRLAKESIFQFPNIMSSAIEAEDQIVIAKSCERNNASLLVSIMSMEGTVDRTRYTTVADYLKTFHSNTDVPAQVWNAGNILLESATLATNEHMTPEETYSLWGVAKEALDMESLNDIYSPYKATQYALESALARIKEAEIATEAKKDEYTVFKDELDKKQSELYTKHPGSQTIKDSAKTYVEHGTRLSQNIKTSGLNKGDNLTSGQIVKNAERLATLEPTLINVSLFNFGNGVKWNQNLVIGVKSMVRVVKSNVMVANMIDATKSGPIFKFIAWTKGELKLHDVLFGTKKYREMGIGNAKKNIMQVLKKRKAIDNVSRLIGSRLLPNVTIIITELEASQIQMTTGVDLHSPGAAKKLIDDYFLLAFGIFDTETKNLDMFYDGDTDFNSNSLRGLSADLRKNTNLMVNNKF